VAAAILNFAKSRILSYGDPCMVNIYLSFRFDENIFIDDRLMAKSQIQDGVRRHLEFNVSVILGPSAHCMVNVYLQTKFGANRFTYC